MEDNTNSNISMRDLKKLSRMHAEVNEYLEANKRTVQEEYDLVMSKQSKLTKSGRDYIQFLYHYEATKAKDNSNDQLNEQLSKAETDSKE